jgi:hypothetical protein
MGTEMKPCPFCGSGDATIASRKNIGATAEWCGDVQWWAFCADGCCVTVGLFETKAEAFDAWNTRPDLGLVEAGLQAVKHKAQHCRDELNIVIETLIDTELAFAKAKRATNPPTGEA